MSVNVTKVTSEPVVTEIHVEMVLTPREAEMLRVFVGGVSTFDVHDIIGKKFYTFDDAEMLRASVTTPLYKRL